MSRNAIYKVAAIMLQIFLGACYVKLQTVFMTQYVKVFGNTVSDSQIILGVLVPLIPNLIILFGVNHYLFKTNPRSLGVFAGLLALTFFYIVSHDQSAIPLIVLTILNWPTLVNMLLLVVTPTVIGVALNRSINRAQRARYLKR